MAQGKKEEAEAVKATGKCRCSKAAELEASEKELNEKVNKIMMTIPNIMILVYQSEKMTARMLKLRSLVSL